MLAALPIKAERGVEFPRDFTREVSDWGDWDRIEPLYERLAARIAEVATAEQLEQWLLDESELMAAIDEEASRRYVAMTCATDDEERERAYLHYVENIEPKLKPWGDRLSRLYLACPARKLVNGDRLAVMDRAIENEVRLFREENVPIETEIAKLSQQYQKLCGAMTVQWQGEERTLSQMNPVQEETDRTVRERAWRLVAERRLQDRDRLNELFDTMKTLRIQTARNAGFENYRDYVHQAKGRFDYMPADCFTFHDAIEREVVPLLRDQHARRARKLGLDTLRPWDLSVDPENAPPLKPFESAAELEAGCAAIFGRLDPRLSAQFEQMREDGLLDLDSRKGKAPGGYQCSLQEVRLPFVFMNAAGTNRDVFTLLHEGGHAFHMFAARKEPLVAYRHAPMEFCEVASMAMEGFALDHLDVFYDNAAELNRAKKRYFEDIVRIFPWIATVDAFQQWIYTNPDHTSAQRDAKFLELDERFGSPLIDWSGLESEHRSAWHRQLHIFELPFYYVEYGIAQMGALQLWLQGRENPRRTLENYLNGLALGGSRPLPELFAAAGIKFDFSAATLGPIMQAVGEELDRLG